MHTIRKQNIKVNAVSNDPFGLKKRVEVLIQEMPQQLSTLFDELVSINELLEIDQLNINIEGIDESKLETELQERIILAIKEKIINLKFKNENNLLSSLNAGVKTSGNRDKNLQAFIYFLENGSLPWWFIQIPHQQWQEQILAAMDEILHKQEKMLTREWAKILTRVLSNTQIPTRLIENFEETVYFKTLNIVLHNDATLAVEVEKLLFNLQALIKNSEIKSKTTISISRQIKIESLKYWLQFSNNKSLHDFAKYLILKDNIKTNNPQLLTQLINEKELYLQLPGNLIIDLKKELVNDEQQKSFQVMIESIEETELNPNHQQQNRKTDVLKDATFINNAGLIIVSPFLPELFNRCGIYKEGEITDNNKAIAFMHYLVFGNCNYKEYDVLLNKIICGKEAHQPILLYHELNEFETIQCNELLQAVISNWTALKNTSIEGLREGFLIRSGKITFNYDEYFLKVENKTIDVLLKQLPWTIGFIKHSWMKKILRTEWMN